ERIRLGLIVVRVEWRFLVVAVPAAPDGGHVQKIHQPLMIGFGQLLALQHFGSRLHRRTRRGGGRRRRGGWLLGSYTHRHHKCQAGETNRQFRSKHGVLLCENHSLTVAARIGAATSHRSGERHSLTAAITLRRAEVARLSATPTPP